MLNDTYEAYFDILDELKASGTMNMFGAPSYLVDNYGLSKDVAKLIFTKWTERYTNG
tara:strand:- start:397 stop:567 length:171 start_codon:yes stop_codon:yes gene_type:complete